MTHKLIKTDNYLLVFDDSKARVEYYLHGIDDIISHLPLNGSAILEGVPLLPPYSRHQEDGIDKKSVDFIREIGGTEQQRLAFKDGYFEAREKYKYTEEDMRKAIDMATTSKHDSTLIFFNAEEIIQYLHQYPTEFECEMEDYCGSPLTTERCPKCIDSCDRAYQRPKTITTAQGVQWVGKYIY